MASNNALGGSSPAQDTASSIDRQWTRIRRYGEILADFARLAPEATSVERLAQLACVQAARGVGIGHSKALRHRPEAGDLLLMAGVGWNQGVVGHATLGTDLATPAGRTFETRQTVILEDAPHDPEFRYNSLLRNHGIVSLLNAPISVDSLVWGVLEVDNTTRRFFGPDDVWFMSALANILRLALYGRMALQRASDAAASSANALQQEHTLLDELRHRGKNDLQLIQAMLVMQKRGHVDARVRRDFDDVMDRIVAIGIAHDQLTPSRGAGRVQLADYLQALCGNVATRRANVSIKTHLVSMEVLHEQAVPLGLIVNKLVTNALKYAFPDDQAGTIQIGFENLIQGEAVLYVRDDGIGMGPPRLGSSGTGLVRRLVQQLGGQLDREDVQHGTSFAVTFPLVA